MKRDISNLTKRDVEGIKAWLKKKKEQKRDFCPFPHRWGEYHCCKNCLSIFPKLKQYDLRASVCPCSQFSLGYVIRVARWVVASC